jgi:hypothetical protein
MQPLDLTAPRVNEYPNPPNPPRGKDDDDAEFLKLVSTLTALIEESRDDLVFQNILPFVNFLLLLSAVVKEYGHDPALLEEGFKRMRAEVTTTMQAMIKMLQLKR